MEIELSDNASTSDSSTRNLIELQVISMCIDEFLIFEYNGYHGLRQNGLIDCGACQQGKVQFVDQSMT